MPDTNGLSVQQRVALITGASSGIGAEFAHQLASRGYGLVLVARREDRLISLAQELEEHYSIPAEVLVADLNEEHGIRKVEARIESLPNLETLVNNAGYGIKGRFHKVDIEKHLAMIQVHVIASVRLSRSALPSMVARQSGGIINVSSMAAFVQLTNPTYCATKTFLVGFSRALQNDILGSGVKIQALCPGFVYTGFHDTSEYEGFKRTSIPRFLWLKADSVVSESLRSLDRGQVVCIPSRRYRLITWLVSSPITAPVVRYIARRILQRRSSTTRGQSQITTGPTNISK